jgi:hypothetical protein
MPGPKPPADSKSGAAVGGAEGDSTHERGVLLSETMTWRASAQGEVKGAEAVGSHVECSVYSVLAQSAGTSTSMSRCSSVGRGASS